MYCDYRILARALMPCPKLLHKYMLQDTNFNTAIKMSKYAINATYKSKIKKKLKRESVKNFLIDDYLNQYAKRIHTIICIKNKLILDYWKKMLDYDSIMRELDNLLEGDSIPHTPYIEKPKKEKGVRGMYPSPHPTSIMIKKHFFSFNAYLEKYKNHNLGLCKAIQYHTYDTKHGVYKYHSKIGREYYLRTGEPPFIIIR